jgi:hypothetical protein
MIHSQFAIRQSGFKFHLFLCVSPSKFVSKARRFRIGNYRVYWQKGHVVDEQIMASGISVINPENH